MQIAKITVVRRLLLLGGEFNELLGAILSLNILLRELTPFEKLVCEHLCDGLTNSAIGNATAHSEKVIENTVSRVSHAFSIRSNGDVNVRVLLSLRYRSYFGDQALIKLALT